MRMTNRQLRKAIRKVLMEADEADEGNAFSGARQEAIDNEEDEFEVDGETYPVEGKKEKTNEARIRRFVRKQLLEANR